MAEDTLSGPFDFALKINAQDKFLRRFAQGDSARGSGRKITCFRGMRLSPGIEKPRALTAKGTKKHKGDWGSSSRVIRNPIPSYGLLFLAYPHRSRVLLQVQRARDVRPEFPHHVIAHGYADADAKPFRSGIESAVVSGMI